VTTNVFGIPARFVATPGDGGYDLVSRQPDTTRTRPAATGALQQISATNQPAIAGKPAGEALVTDKQGPEKPSEPSDAVKVAIENGRASLRVALIGIVVALIGLFKPEKERAPAAPPPAPQYIVLPSPRPAVQPVDQRPTPRHRSRPPPKSKRR
jgi:hypothetical protein